METLCLVVTFFTVAPLSFLGDSIKSSGTQLYTLGDQLPFKTKDAGVKISYKHVSFRDMRKSAYRFHSSEI